MMFASGRFVLPVRVVQSYNARCGSRGGGTEKLPQGPSGRKLRLYGSQVQSTYLQRPMVVGTGELAQGDHQKLRARNGGW